MLLWLGLRLLQPPLSQPSLTFGTVGLLSKCWDRSRDFLLKERDALVESGRKIMHG